MVDNEFMAFTNGVTRLYISPDYSYYYLQERRKWFFPEGKCSGLSEFLNFRKVHQIGHTSNVR